MRPLARRSVKPKLSDLPVKNKFTNPFAEFPREVGVLVFASFLSQLALESSLRRCHSSLVHSELITLKYGAISRPLPLHVLPQGSLAANSLITLARDSSIHLVSVLFLSLLCCWNGAELQPTLNLPCCRRLRFFYVLSRSGFNFVARRR
jgi:hypothetical protein